jgi:hypothetical protein
VVGALIDAYERAELGLLPEFAVWNSHPAAEPTVPV